MSRFTPAWFLPGPHAQTIWGRLVRPRRLVNLRREVLTTPDDDDLILDHLDTPDATIHFVLLHGLEGSSQSVYIQGILDEIARHGGSATALNFRSCARDPKSVTTMLPNRRPRFYHSGEITDFDFTIRELDRRSDLPRTKVAFGASLGGNALLKWLAANPDQSLVRAAATISVPYDLGAGAKYLENRMGRFYVASFLRTLRRKVLRVVREFPESARDVDLDKALNATTFREFDDAATAPLHGFADADDYYARASSIFDLGRIRTPTLCISAEDDPFVPREVLQRVRETASDSIELWITPHGGHVGFVSGSLPWRCQYWAEQALVEWLIAKAANSTPTPQNVS